MSFMSVAALYAAVDSLFRIGEQSLGTANDAARSKASVPGQDNGRVEAVCAKSRELVEITHEYFRKLFT